MSPAAVDLMLRVGVPLGLALIDRLKAPEPPTDGQEDLSARQTMAHQTIASARFLSEPGGA